MTDEADQSAMQRGIAMRKRIAGDIPRTSGVDDDLYELILKYAFGDVWSRPGLDFDTRRLLTLSMTLAGGHLAEFKLHTRFALKNGVPYATIKELVIHSAVYCGIPAALGGFRALSDVARELDIAP